MWHHPHGTCTALSSTFLCKQLQKQEKWMLIEKSNLWAVTNSICRSYWSGQVNHPENILHAVYVTEQSIVSFFWSNPFCVDGLKDEETHTRLHAVLVASSLEWSVRLKHALIKETWERKLSFQNPFDLLAGKKDGCSSCLGTRTGCWAIEFALAGSCGLRCTKCKGKKPFRRNLSKAFFQCTESK